jgi:hypothetical protein
LSEYKGMLLATSGSSGFLPRTVPYPRHALGLARIASLRPLPGGGWWVPSDLPARTYDFGPAGRAYEMDTEQGKDLLPVESGSAPDPAAPAPPVKGTP